MAVGEELVSHLTAAVDAVCHADPELLADGETVVALHRQLERLEAATTRATGRLRGHPGYEADGARWAAAWIAARCRLPLPAAHRRLRLGRGLRHLPHAEAACPAGDQQRAPPAVPRLCPGAAYWSQGADPDGVEDQAAARHAARRLHLSRTLGDTWCLDGQLDPIAGAIVAGELRCIDDELFHADWAEAKDRLGEAVGVGGPSPHPRPTAGRRPGGDGQALGRAPRAGPAGRAAVHRPGRLRDLRRAHLQLADGTVVSPGSLVPSLDQAWVERVVFDGPSRVIDVGVRRRIFSGATRRAVQVRDQECFHDRCAVAAEDCEVDHVEPYSLGGLTTQANGRAACAFHNRHRHRRP